MKKAFTLIEILLAVMILLISSTIFISISQNTKHLLKILLIQKDKVLLSSTMIDAKNNQNLYDTLISFNIDNDKIIHSLKKKHFSIQTNDISSELTEIKVNNIKYYKVK